MPTVSEFTVGSTITVDNRRVVLTEQFDQDGAQEFQIRLHGESERAWAIWATPPMRWPRRAQVTALGCGYCWARTQRRCCQVALCAQHHLQHHALEHVAPDAGRYHAALACPPELLDRRYVQPPEPVAGVSYPRDLSLPLSTDPRKGDGLRVAEYVRLLTSLPGGSDPIGEALREVAAGRRRLPTPAKARWVAADILARCTWPALVEAMGDQAGARWIRQQPQVVAGKPTALSEKLFSLDNTALGLRLPVRLLPAGQMAATDALCGLEHIAPTVARGAVWFSYQVGGEVFSHVLTLPDGPERVGRAVARAQQDAIATVLGAISTA